MFSQVNVMLGYAMLMRGYVTVLLEYVVVPEYGNLM